MTGRLVRGGIALATMGGAMALGFASPASAADTGVSVLEKIKQCESGGDYTAENPSSTASGAYQFIDSTFRALNASQGYTHAADAPESVQDAAAIELYNEQGTAPWAPSESCWSAAGATSPSSEANTGGTGAVTPETEGDAASPGAGSGVDEDSSSAQADGTQVGAPAPQAPAEQAPVEQQPVEQAPVEEQPVEQAPVEQQPVEDAEQNDGSEQANAEGGNAEDGGAQGAGPQGSGPQGSGPQGDGHDC